MINNELDLATARIRLHRDRRVQITDFLQADAARRLLACLKTEVDWSLAIRLDGNARTLLPAEQIALGPAGVDDLQHQAQLQARHAFQFCYDSYMMVRAASDPLVGKVPLLLMLLDFLNSPDFLAFSHWLTGDKHIAAVTAQATRYRPGCFLTRHEDLHEGERRAYAFVLNLTPAWNADWGGLLQFMDDEGQVSETFMPRWNSLSLFKVPQAHSVTLVTPWANEERLAITGWFLQG